jgi:hypothetical protein
MTVQDDPSEVGTNTSAPDPTQPELQRIWNRVVGRRAFPAACGTRQRRCAARGRDARVGGER